MFSKDDDIVGVDIDHCYNAETNEFNDIARAIIDRQPTYVEFSPSGDGVHLYFKGVKPKGSSKNTENGVEMYDSVRYFTVTEKQLPGSLDTISEGTDTLQWIYETYIKKQRKPRAKKKKSANKSVELTDDELLEKAKSSDDGEAFIALLEGNWQENYQSQSLHFGRVKTGSRWSVFFVHRDCIVRSGTRNTMRTALPTERKP